MEKRYNGICSYTKKINGEERVLVKQLSFSENVEDAIEACKKFYREKIKTKPENFYISVWECLSWSDRHPSIPVKVEEIKNII